MSSERHPVENRSVGDSVESGDSDDHKVEEVKKKAHGGRRKVSSAHEHDGPAVAANQRQRRDKNLYP